MKTERKKYLIVLSGFKLGGAERQAIYFAEYLKNLGNDVCVVSFTEPDKVCDICDDLGIEWRSFSRNKLHFGLMLVARKLHLLKKYIRPYVAIEVYVNALKRYIKKNKYDVCISYYIYANLWLGRVAETYRAPIYIWYQRDPGVMNNDDEYEKRAINAYDLVLSNNYAGKEWLQNHHNIKVDIIENGMKITQPRFCRKEWRLRLSVLDEDIVCVMVANVHSGKDHMSILKIWNKLVQEGIKYPLFFAGRMDNGYDELFDYIDKSGLTELVSFLGPVDDVYGLLGSADIFVYGTKYEGLSNSVIEAGMMGLPIVAMNMPGINDVVSEENIKFLFDKEDIDSAVRNIRVLGENPRLRHELGIANRTIIAHRFDRKVNFDRIIHMVDVKSI